jgi:hypothetical protein
MNTNLNPQVFRDIAAKILSGEERFCCLAITFLVRDERYNQFLASVFKPSGHKSSDPWWSEFSDYNAREARILALLLCAEMCKSSSSSEPPRHYWRQR